jgi:WD40 repeat protein/HEAT repeat protein
LSKAASDPRERRARYLERHAAKLASPKNEAERNRAALALGRSRHPAALKQLLTGLGEDDRRECCALGLARFWSVPPTGVDPKQTESALLEAFRRRPYGRATAEALVAALALTGGEASIDPLLGDEEKRSAHASALGRIVARLDRNDLFRRMTDPWRSPLQQGDADTIERAGEFAAQLKRPEQIALLFDRIARHVKRGPARTREAAIRAAGTIGAATPFASVRKRAIRVLASALADPDLRIEAAEALIPIARAAEDERDGIHHALLKRLDGSSLRSIAGLRAFATHVAAAFKDPGDLLPLDMVLRRQDQQIAAHPRVSRRVVVAARCLMSLLWWGMRLAQIPARIRLELRLGSLGYRETAVLRSAGPAILDLLFQQLRRGRFLTIAAEVVGDIGGPQDCIRAGRLLSSRTAQIRRAGAEILGRIVAPDALPALLPLVSDRDPLVRLAAVTAIGRKRIAQALPALLPALKDPDPPVRRAAIAAAAALAKEPIPQLEALLDDPDPAVREEVVKAIAAADDPVPKLAPLLDKSNDTVMLAAVLRALGATHRADAIRAVVPFLLHRDKTIVSASVDAVRALGWEPNPDEADPRCGLTLERWRRAAAQYRADTGDWEKFAAVREAGPDLLIAAFDGETSSHRSAILHVMAKFRGDERMMSHISKFLGSWKLKQIEHELQQARISQELKQLGAAVRDDEPREKSVRPGLDTEQEFLAAINALGEIGNSGGYGALVKLMNDVLGEEWAEYMVKQIIEALGAIGSWRARETLERLLIDKPDQYGKEAAAALRAMGAVPVDRRACLRFHAFLGKWKRCLAVAARAPDECEGTIRDLVELGFEKDPAFLLAAGRSRSPAALRYLANLLAGAASAAPVERALREAGPAAAPFLLDVLPATDQRHQSQGVALLAQWLETSDDAALAKRCSAALIAIAENPRPLLRHAALRALARILPRHPDPQLATTIMRMFADSDDNVRQAAVACCVALGDMLVPRLTELMRSRGTEQECALRALVAIGSDKAREAIRSTSRAPVNPQGPIHGGSRRSFRVFISSTFEDFKSERNALHREVFPRLRRLCEQFGASFQAIDLRWGISEDDALDQETMHICLEEIARCREISPRPSFVCLIGNRYGWRPLPDRIKQDEYEQIERVLPPDEAALLHAWYQRDDNAVPPVHVLKSRRGTVCESYADWDRTVAGPLSRALQGAVDRLSLLPDYLTPQEFDHVLWLANPQEAALLQEHYPLVGDIHRLHGRGEDAKWYDEVQRPLHLVMHRCCSQILKYFASATHQEIVHGALWSKATAANSFAFIREIDNLAELQQAAAADTRSDEIDPAVFIDTSRGGRDADTLAVVKNDLNTMLGSRAFTYRAAWTAQGLSTDHAALCEAVYSSLSDDILSEISLSLLGRADEAERDQAEHEGHARTLDRFFTGRRTETARIMDFLADTEGRILAVMGDAGTGKSALMAHAWLEARKRYSSDVLVRFCGATPASTDLGSLLGNLCRCLAGLQGVRDYYVPSTIEDLSAEFARLIGGWDLTPTPLIIFLDALDQLRTPREDVSLSWLPERLPPNVKLVVSSLPGERNELRFAIEERVREDCFINVSGLPLLCGARLLKRRLAAAGRRLEREQRKHVLRQFAASGLPLYLDVAFQRARSWRSSNCYPGGSADLTLPTDIRELLYQTICDLWRNAHHNQLLVTRCLGLLAAANDGLSESELLDLLSRDADVYAEFLAGIHHVPPDLADCIANDVKGKDGSRAVIAALDRLKSDPVALKAYLQRVLVEEDGPTLPIVLWSRLYFSLRYFVRERSGYGVTLFGFFHRLVREVIEERFLSGDEGPCRHREMSRYFAAQPWWTSMPGRVPKLRKAAELVRHHSLGGEHDAVVAALTDLDYIAVKCCSGRLHELLTEYEAALRQAALSAEESGRLRDFAAFAGRRQHVLADAPELVYQEAARHLSGKAARLQAEQRLAKMPEWSFEWDNCPSPAAEYSAMPGGRVLAITPDGFVITTLDDALFVWDRRSGSLRHVLNHRTPVRDAVLMPHSGVLITAGNDHLVRMWNWRDGRYLYSPGTALQGVVSLAADAAESVLVAGHGDGTITAWDIARNRPIRTLGRLPNTIAQLRVDTAANVIAVDEAHNTALFAIGDETKIVQLPGSFGLVQDAVLHPSGLRLLATSGDKTMVFDTECRVPAATLPGSSSARARFASAERIVMIDGRTLRLHRIADGTLDSQIEIDDFFDDLLVSPTGARALAVSGRSVTAVDFDRETRRRLPVDGAPLLAWSDDGRRFALITATTVQVYDFAEEQPVWRRVLKRPSDPPFTGIALNHDGSVLAAADDAGTIHIMAVEDGAAARTIKAHQAAVNAIAFAGSLLASAGADLAVKVWDWPSGELRQGFEPEYEVLHLRADTLRIAGYGDEAGFISYLADPARMTTVPFDVERVMAAENGEPVLVAAMPGGQLELWDPRSGAVRGHLDHHGASITAMAASETGVLASADAEGGVALWALDDGRLMGSWDAESAAQLMVCSADGRSLAILNAAGSLELRLAGAPAPSWTARPADRVDSLVLSDTLVAAGSSDGPALTWDLPSGAAGPPLRRYVFAESKDAPGQQPCTDLVVLPEQGMAISAESGALVTWDLGSGARKCSFEGFSAPVTAFAVFPIDGEAFGGRRLHVLLGGTARGQVKQWALEFGICAGTQELDDAKPVTGFSRSHGDQFNIEQDDTRIYLPGRDQTLILTPYTLGLRSHDATGVDWNVKSTWTYGFYQNQHKHLTLGPDGETFVVWAEESTAYIGRVSDTNDFRRLTFDAPVSAMHFAPDGRMLAAGTQDGMVSLWDVKLGNNVGTLASRDGVTAVDFTADGRQMTTSARDGSVRLWDRNTGSQIACFFGLSPMVNCRVAAPGGERLAAIDDHGRFYLLTVKRPPAART